MRRSRVKVIGFGLILALGTALVVDRVTLYVWQWQVIRLYHTLQASVASGEARPPKRPFGYVSIGLEPLVVMPKSESSPIRYVTLQTDVPLAEPSGITVDGGGGLHLRFLPPALAWTTRVIPRRDPGEHADPVGYDPRLQYQYKISIEPIGTNDVALTLNRGPYHFDEPLKPEDQRPLFFP